MVSLESAGKENQLVFAQISARSEIGLHREGNEDSGFYSSTLLAVADGMGGHVGGEIASRTVIQTLASVRELISHEDIDIDSREDLLRSVASQMDSEIALATAAKPELAGMGTTLTALSLINNHVVLLHIGDSRAYRVREKKILQLSYDHTVLQELLDQGRLTRDEIADHPQRSLLTQALMGSENIEPILVAYPIEKDDIYILCSDGLSSVISDQEILQCVEKEDLKSSLDAMMESTYKKDAPDNVTIIIAKTILANPAPASFFIGAAE